jgi:hypothetical protein
MKFMAILLFKVNLLWDLRPIADMQNFLCDGY